MRNVLTLLLLALILTGCGATPPAPTTPPAPPVVSEPAPAPEPPPVKYEVPVTFHVRIGGKGVEPSPPFSLPTSDPVAVEVRFSEAVDRSSAEQAVSRRIPAGSTFAWADDQTLVVTVAEGGAFEIDASGAKAAAGTRTVVASSRPVYRPPLTFLEVYRVSDLLTGAKSPAYRHRVPWPTSAVALSPGGKTALYYSNDPFMPTVPPTLVDLATGRETRLPVPGGEWDTYSLGGWLPDGRLFLVGRQVFVGDGAGREMKAITTEASGWISALSPTGSHVAIWMPGAAGRVTLVDMQTGQSRLIDGPFRRGAQDGAITLGWSPDGKLLAGTDNDAEDGGRSARIRIIDPFSGQQVRTIEGVGLYRWLPSGEFLAWKRITEEKGFQSVLLRLSPEGQVTGEMADSEYPSPDGQYSIAGRPDPQGGPIRYHLIEVATGREVPLQDWPRWASSSQIYVIAQQQ